jgi:Cd(II)/Pb(II)-responsive transcriptional regulator
MKIGELAKLTDCSVQTIRYYEKEQLLKSPERSEGNFRLYNKSFIKQCRTLDLTLSEIRQLLELQSSPSIQCNSVNNMIDSHIQQVEQRIKELNSLKEQLNYLSNTCSNNGTIEQCGILQKLTSDVAKNV